jgi:uncharacterized protein YkwD
VRGVSRVTGLGGLQMMAAAASLCASLITPLAGHAATSSATATATATTTAVPRAATVFVHDINVSRVAAGLRPLKVSPDLTAVANKWAVALAKKGGLAHNPALGSAIKNWTGLAENVGMGQTAAQLHAAFMHSAPHRANILAPIYTQVGVGVVVVDHEIFVVEDFRRPA